MPYTIFAFHQGFEGTKFPLAQVCTPLHPATAEANAYMLAGAPALFSALDALTQLTEEAVTRLCQADQVAFAEKLDDLRDDAKDALAKALEGAR